MNTFDSPAARRMSAWLMSAATLLVATAITAWAPAVQAQSGKAMQSSGAAICDFDGFTYNAATNTLTINCTTATQPPPADPNAPGTFSLSPTAVSIAPGTTTTVNIVRTGGSTGSYSVGYSVTASGLTGWSVNGFAGSNAVWFDAGQTSVLLNITAGTTTGTMTIALGGTLPNAPTAVTTTASGSTTVTVTTGATGGNPTPPPPPPPGCTTSAHHTASFDFNGQKHVFDLKPGETAAVSFRTKDISDIEVSTTETVNTPITADHQVAVSTCPGDFSKTSPCMYTANLTGQTMFTTTQPLAWWAAGSKCKLDPNTTYYMNIRQVKRDDTTVNACTSFSCQVRAQVQNF